MPASDWGRTTLGSVATVSTGSTPSRAVADYWNGDVLWVTTGEIDYKDIYDTREKITRKALEATSLRLHGPGVVLLAMIGQGATRGRVARLRVHATTNQNCCAISPSEQVDSDFLYYYLESQYQQIRGLSNSGGQQNLNTELVRNIPILLAPLEEQRRIATILAEWDSSIMLNAQLISAKQERKRAFMQQLLRGKRRFLAFQKRWYTTTFGEVFSAKNVRNVGSRIRNPITVGKYAIRPQAEHFNRVVASDNLDNYNVIESGDFVYDPMSAYYGAFGRYELDEPGIVSPVYRVLCLNPGYDSDFIKHLIKSHYITHQLTANSSQGNRQGKRRTIQDEAFESISVAIPHIDEQQAIARVLNACDSELALLERRLVLRKRQKQGLMQQLLTGRVWVAA